MWVLGMSDWAHVQQVMEPEKCTEWIWSTWEDVDDLSRLRINGEIAELLFTPLVALIKQRAGFDPFHVYQNRRSGIQH